MLDLLELLLAAPAPTRAYADLDAFLAAARGAPLESPFDRAVFGGARADRLGYAFAAGYREALVALLPELAHEPAPCLCATEEGGVHPAAIATRLAQGPDGGFVLTGRKTFATLARPSSTLLVVASLGAGAAGRNRLKVARVPASRAGITLRPLPPLPFAPEIAHAAVELDGVHVLATEVLDGDGWERWSKPFRTVEDVHVVGAALGLAVAEARARGRSHGLVEDALAAVAALRSVAPLDPSRRETHVALAGALTAARGAIDRLMADLEPADDEAAVRLRRDRRLLDVAASARTRRRDAAWAELAGNAGDGA